MPVLKPIVGNFVVLKTTRGQIVHAGRVESVIDEPVFKVSLADGSIIYWPQSRVETVEERIT